MSTGAVERASVGPRRGRVAAIAWVGGSLALVTVALVGRIDAPPPVDAPARTVQPPAPRASSEADAVTEAEAVRPASTLPGPSVGWSDPITRFPVRLEPLSGDAVPAAGRRPLLVAGVVHDDTSAIAIHVGSPGSLASRVFEVPTALVVRATGDRIEATRVFRTRLDLPVDGRAAAVVLDFRPPGASESLDGLRIAVTGAWHVIQNRVIGEDGLLGGIVFRRMGAASDTR
jgi:hypothetical protein